MHVTAWRTEAPVSRRRFFDGFMKLIMSDL